MQLLHNVRGCVVRNSRLATVNWHPATRQSARVTQFVALSTIRFDYSNPPQSTLMPDVHACEALAASDLLPAPFNAPCPFLPRCARCAPGPCPLALSCTNYTGTMNASPFSFQLLHVAKDCHARRGTFFTPHGPVELPAFMPVGTQATVKGLTVEQIHASGAQMVLANTYHPWLFAAEARRDRGRTEADRARRFLWVEEGPIPDRQRRFQAFFQILAAIAKITEQGALFRSHIDGNLIELTPERAVEIQAALGSDVAMVLDHVVALPNEPAAIRDAMERHAFRLARRLAAQRARTAWIKHNLRLSREVSIPNCASNAPSGSRRWISPGMPSAA